MKARLIVQEGVANPAQLDLTLETPVSLGRSRDNAMVLRDEHASRLHAKIYFDADRDRWFVQDFGLNGTRIDGERVNQIAEIDHGQLLRIGDVTIRFEIEGGKPLAPLSTSSGRHTAVLKRPPSTTDLVATTLQVDELTALCHFMANAVETEDVPNLVRLGLEAVIQQTGANVAGYLSIDVNDPLPKLVLPDSDSVDKQLSRQLTRRVQLNNRTVWLGGEAGPSRPSDSLTAFSDALCVPLRATGASLGALHVYKQAATFNERDVRFVEALAGYLGHALHVLRVRRNLEAENSRLRGHSVAADDLLGDSLVMQQLRMQIERVAPQPSTVLIYGESGVGKELVATSLHKKSQRAGNPLVVVNCAAIAPSLMEGELFGYRKGAFSGAERDYPGLFQLADEGTLFLDEIGELSLDCQAKLLRVIEGHPFRPIGATANVHPDVRIIAATNRDLEQEVRAGRFRKDLLYRLKVIQINVPPLRDHSEDIPLLVQYLLDKLAVECRRQVTLTEAALMKLQAYSWPGNVRQLRAVLESVVVLSEWDAIDADSICLPATDLSMMMTDLPTSLNMEELETWAIGRAMKSTNNNITQAARMLGMSRDTLHNKLKRKGLRVSGDD